MNEATRQQATWKLSASDLTFLWDECPRCFYLKVVRGLGRPSMAFPGVFQRIDGLMKRFFEGMPAEEISPALPPGRVRYADRWVTSEPVPLPGHAGACAISGRFDTVLEFADGSWAVIDFKTTQPRPEHVRFYSRQLHAYAYALEHPAAGRFGLAPVSRLGLLCVSPERMDRTEAGAVALLGEARWLECPKDEPGFLVFLERVVSLLEQPLAPPAAPGCGWCKYREAARETGL